MRRIGLGGILLGLFLALACNAPFAEPTVLAPPTLAATAAGETPASPTATATPASAEATTEPAGSDETAPAATAPGDTATPRPTFTPIQQPTLANSPTALPSSTPRATSTPRSATATATKTAGSGGPLSLDYQVSWSLSPADPFKAIASVTLTANGGSGVYTYYHDDLAVPGPNFTYEWGACRGNPGSFRVDSSDGQSVRVDYFENPPCPTPTPTSSP